MSTLELAYANGQLAALLCFKHAGLAPTHPAVRNSAVNTAKAAPKSPTVPAPAIDPPTLAQQFNAAEQQETRLEPRRKLSANICTSCRKDKHYGPCKRPVPIPLKRAEFNTGMTADDASGRDSAATSPHYSAATSLEARPADEQASTAFRDLLRARDLMMTNGGDLLTGGLAKVSGFLRTQVRDGTTNDTEMVWRSFDASSDATSIEGNGEPFGGPAA